MNHFETDFSSEKWDKLLTQFGGHPLQSALWGNAKSEIYGIKDERLAFYIQNQLIALVRIEQRGFKPFLKLAWIPQGPTIAIDSESQIIHEGILKQLKKTGYLLYIATPWKSVLNTDLKGMRKTIWIDLKVGKEKLWMNLDKQWRYGVRSAERLGMKISFGNSDQDLAEFYCLCINVSQKKKFRFQYNLQFLQYLLEHSDENGVEAKLFLVKYDNKIAAGALIMRAGKNAHYMIGAVDRDFSKQRVGEFIQWKIIEWACEQNCMRYDLEGINTNEDSTVAAFKKKMGGEIIHLPNLQINYLNWRGKILSNLIRKKLQWA